MPVMNSFFCRNAVPIALLLSLFMFSGVVSSSIVFADHGAPKQCCGDESTHANPVNEVECVDCGCLGCVSVTHPADTLNTAPAVTSVLQQWLILAKHPSGYLRSIEYPPEIV